MSTQTKSKSHTISVTVEGRTISVSPDPLRMTSADDLKWIGAGSQKFRIEFDGAGPFAIAKLAHDEATKPQRPRVTGRFKYTVLLESDPSVKLDPEVIVGDPPSTPGP